MYIVIIYHIFNIKRTNYFATNDHCKLLLRPNKYAAESEEDSTEAFLFIFYHQLYGGNRLLLSNGMEGDFKGIRASSGGISVVKLMAVF